MELVCKEFDVTMDQLTGPRRNVPALVKGRQICMWLILKKCGLSLKETGELFNRDHTTIIYSRDMVKDQLDPITGENEYKEAVRKLMEVI